MKKIALEEEFILEGYVVKFIKEGSSIKISRIRKHDGKKPKSSNPSLEEVISYFKEKGYSEHSATEFFNYYSNPDKPDEPWKDSQGTLVKDWQAKARRVWFKDKNKQGAQTLIATPITHVVSKPKGAKF
nr:hypothetical protein [uncultured Flavobacterium sp.]